ncbi:C39 family peptidase [Streptomyces brevispora]|uniref:C39 family peptidase n=1 Tax=Streptomyces brevispora TaxID=887462 RepID=UPI003710DC19
MTHSPRYPCCADAPLGPQPVHSPVPPFTQYASPSLIEAIAYRGHDPADDPAWARSGAPTQQEYGQWSRHLCGMVCMQMALVHRDGMAPTLWALRNGALRAGAYQVDGQEVRGLIYQPFAEYVEQVHGIGAEVHRHLSLNELQKQCDAGRMVMASVSKGIRTPQTEPARRGGHLVLVLGVTELGQVHFNNPSGHTPQTRKAVLHLDEFERFFGGRGVSLDLHPLSPSAPPGVPPTP